jgi:cobalt-zinc-cadmium efflux system membrane fusion protein
MRHPVRISKRVGLVFVAAAAVVVATGILELGRGRVSVANANTRQQSDGKPKGTPSEPSVELTASQLNSIKIAPVDRYQFPVEKDAVGSISFADDSTVQVYPPYQGKIIKSLAELGDEVKKGQPLYTIDSPDLIQAESS